MESKTGQRISATLKGFWFRNLPYTNSPDDAKRYVLAFRSHIQGVYGKDKRMKLKENILAWVDWEDFYFYPHLAWAYIEDAEGALLFAVKIYSFDYELAYLGNARLNNEKQIALPMERKAHVLSFARNEYQRHFLYPFWSVPEHSQLRAELFKLIEGDAETIHDMAPEGYFEVRPRALSPQQVDLAVALHQKWQVAELSRYSRSPEADKDYDFMPALAFATAILMRSENIQNAKVEAITRAHRKFWEKLFELSGVIPIDDGPLEAAIFNASLQRISNMAHIND